MSVVAELGMVAETAVAETAVDTVVVTDTVKLEVVAVVVATVIHCHNGNIPADHRLHCYRNKDTDTSAALKPPVYHDHFLWHIFTTVE